jgi:hypothetical protein
MLTPNPISVNLSKEFAMARLVPSNCDASASLSPQERAKPASKGAEGSRTLAGMLLAAAMAALLVVADQVIDTWADGHLLAGWVALWTVAFAALALLAPPLRQLSAAMALAIRQWARAAELRRQEEAMWAYAQQDPRTMAELTAACGRDL